VRCECVSADDTVTYVGPAERAVEAGNLEAAEHDDRPFTLGVQWHPEVGEDGSLFAALVAAASPAGA
jgi:gamma-glutamyl-gamma-aminobutyrate hydrolase PuuD